MTKFIKKLFVAIGIVFFIVSPVLANEHFTTDDMSVVYDKALELSKKYESGNILVVFDIDNTLLSMSRPLGSDQWFTWQEDLIQKKILKNSVANDFQGLLDAQGLLFSLSPMKPSQKEIPNIVHNLVKDGFKLMVLTSRSEEFMYSTLRELLNNGMDIRKASPEQAEHMKIIFPNPYRIKTMKEKYGFTNDEIISYKLTKKPVDITDLYGVFFTSGQHKGAMLRISLAETKCSPKAIIFVDDKEKHTARVQDAFKNSAIEVVTYRYSKEDKKVEDFVEKESLKTASQWENLQKAYIDGNVKKIDSVLKRNFGTR